MTAPDLAPLAARLGHQDYCGCCGREVRQGAMWCDDCKPHLRPMRPRGGLGCIPGDSAWDRTYYAQFGKDCPFQVGGDA